MFIARLRRKTQIRRRKGERETLAEDAVRFQVKFELLLYCGGSQLLSEPVLYPNRHTGSLEVLPPFITTVHQTAVLVPCVQCV